MPSLNKSGASRYVILTKRYALKVPRWSHWRTFLQGLLANMQESTFGSTGWPEICPVLFSLPGGFLVVMPRVRVLTMQEFLENEEQLSYMLSGCLDTGERRRDYVVPAEMKPDSFGWYRGRLVAVDYG